MRDHAWVGPLCAVVVLGLWSAGFAVGWLPLAAAGVVAGAVLDPRSSLVRRLALGILLVAIVAAFHAHRQVDVVEQEWSTYWSEREDEVGRQLNEALQSLLDDGEQAATRLGELGSEPGALPDPRDLTELRERHGVTALALYDNDGELRVWDGVHRGPVPEPVQLGGLRYAYDERPLFGYLYVTASADGVGTAVAAFLLRTDLPGSLAADAQDFASRFRRDVGEEIRLFPVPLAKGQGGWELEVDGRVLVSVVLEPPQPSTRSAELLDGWQRGVFALTLLAWLLLSVGAPAGWSHSLLAGGALLVLAATVPLPPAGVVADAVVRPSVRLPGVGALAVGRLALLAAALVTAVAVLPHRNRRPSPVVVGLVVAGAAPVAGVAFQAVATPSVLGEAAGSWVTFQALSVLALAAVLGPVLSRSRTRRPRAGHVVGGAGGAVALALLVGAWVRYVGVPPVLTGALWGLPAWWVARGLGGESRWTRPLLSWSLAVVLAGTFLVPLAWGERVEARRDAAEARLQRLLAPSDPELEADLSSMAEAVRVLEANGADGVELLYGALRRSGFAEAGHPAWLSLWSPAGVPQEELRVGTGPNRPPAAADAVTLPRESGARILAYDRDDARYVLRVPLRNGRSFTAAAPPFRETELRSALSPLLMGEPRTSDPLTLIPLEEEGEAPATDVVRWTRSAGGWRATTRVRYPGAAYEAQVLVGLPGLGLAVARGTLLILLDGVLVLLFWGLGRSLLREVGPPRPALRGLVISFRARVTLALFGFFVLANALFGTLAYRTIDRASQRAAEVLAERVAEDAAGWYFEESGAMELLARRVGAELLEYRGGEIREGSVEELVELGLYEAWIPYEVYRSLEDRESIRGVRRSALGAWQYVTAYRRLPDGDLLGAPVPLQAGATAIGSADVLQLLGFALLVGGALSLSLALLVSQALTRPIRALQVASERVGAGNLRFSLPEREADEFGAVFEAFNRMVRRLRRARRQLVRTTRRTQAIMEEAAVGIVAVDPGGRVTLVNPRAERLLGVEVELGQGVPREAGAGEELGAWLTAYLGGQGHEAGLELLVDDRRIRVRARRLEGAGSPGGAVVALEDVTDELRTERVLAWGEMARQVAHEVKNPLTPMKLSIQHLRRAWEDGHPDFDEILVRNAEAVLTEIDRLAAIAQSFSRFGAPAEGRGAPLAPVDVVSVVREVMALYGASEGPVDFRRELPDALPTVRARSLELKEVLVNLLENAREALQDGGMVRVVGALADDGRVVLRVQDDGAGVPPELMPRVFEPHFSTRSGGTGLGLAIVRRLVESWGGSVALESEPGAGAVVTVHLLPWTDDESPTGVEGAGLARRESAS